MRLGSGSGHPPARPRRPGRRRAAAPAQPVSAMQHLACIDARTARTRVHFHPPTPAIPQQKLIRARASTALASCRMRTQEQWRSSRKSPAAHQKARRRSSHFRKKIFRGKKPRALPRPGESARKRLQIQARARWAANAQKNRRVRVCALSRIHRTGTASMTLARHRRAQLASNASDLQGVARHGTAPSLRSACDARAPAWCSRDTRLWGRPAWAFSLQLAVSSVDR